MNQQARRTAFLDEMRIGPLWVSKSRGYDATGRKGAEELIHASAVADEGKYLSTASSASDHDTDAARAGGRLSPAVNALDADASAMSWSQLETAVAGCTRCDLCKTRTRTVFGIGDQQAKWLFVGEGPGRNEDVQGLPFVGPAGRLLDSMLLAMGLRREQNAYIANVVKCRPTDSNKRDRRPDAAEIDACIPYLQRQIELINPAVIVALGKTAALSLLKLDPATPVANLRGIVHRYAERPLIVTYHPAYLLRAPADKSKTWADLCLAMQSYSDAVDHN